MKTMTIFSAYKISEDRLTKSFTVVCDGDPLTVIAYLKKYHRQANKFWNALVERMEAGDRARATLDKMINVEWADDESVADMFFKLDKILDNYVNGEEEPRP